MTRTLPRTRVLAALTVLLLGAALTAAVTSSDTDARGAEDVEVLLDRETVNVRMDADGEVEEQNLLTHLTVTGRGEHVVEDPAATSQLRSMSGFPTPIADPNEEIVRWEVDLDGEAEELRTMSTHAEDPPAEVDAAYTLDGEAVTADELEGRSGRLEVTFDIRNVSAQPMELSWRDDDGEEVTDTLEVPLPLVGTVELVLDERFDDIDVGDAIVAGDGEGGTQLQWSIPLFAPLGETEEQLTFSADVVDAAVPSMRATLVPAGSHQSPVDTGMESFEEITDALTEIEDGAQELDEGALELADGAAELLEGLGQIADGSDELAAGLDEAAAGSDELAEGADELDAGTSEALEGAREIQDGIDQVEEGTAQLTAPDAVPAALDGVDELVDGAQEASAGAQELADGLCEAADSPFIEVLGGLGDLVDELPDGLEDLLAELLDDLDPTELAGFADDLEEACEGATELAEGLGAADEDDTIVGGLTELQDGLTEAAGGLDELNEGAMELQEGQGELVEGLAEIDEGTAELAEGADELDDGLTEAREGAGELDEGAEEAAEGGGELSEGAQELQETGTSLLAGEVAEGRAEQSEELALFRATAERGVEDGMPYGPPDDTDGVAAYVYDLAGTDHGESPGVVAVLATMLLLATAGAVATALRHRLRS